MLIDKIKDFIILIPYVVSFIILTISFLIIFPIIGVGSLFNKVFYK